MKKKLSQKGGRESMNLQDCDNVQIGLSYSETKALFVDLFELNFPKFRAIAQEEAKNNIEKLSNKFADRLQKLDLIDTKILETPDFHFNLYRAIEIGARHNDENLQDTLAELLVKRISFNGDDTIRTILNESIQTVEKVSNNQLKMLTFSFFMFEYWTKMKIKTWAEFNEYVVEYIQPFMDYEYKDIDILHLNYCGSINYDSGFGRPSLSQILKNRIPSLYPDISQQKDEQKYIDSVTTGNLINSADFFDMMNKTKLWAIDPTSVGLMLINVHFEIQKGYKIPSINEYFQ
jgi:hypothetical protein